MAADPWDAFPDAKDPWDAFPDADEKPKPWYGDRQAPEGFTGDLTNSVRENLFKPLALGTLRARSFLNTATGDYTEAADLNRRSEAYAPSKESQQRMDEIGQEKTVGGALLGYLKNPGAALQVSAESLPMSTPSLALGGIGLLAGPMGGAAGAGLGSFATEYTSSINQSAQELGIDMTDPTQLEQVMTNPVFLSKAREKAVKRGVPVAAFDALSFGLAGKFARGIGGLGLGKGATLAAGGTAEVVAQASAGMAGEAGGQLASEGRITSPAEIAAEGVGEIVPGIAETAFGTPQPFGAPGRATDGKQEFLNRLGLGREAPAPEIPVDAYRMDVPQLEGPPGSIKPPPPDFVVDPMGRAARPGEAIPDDRRLPPPQGTGEFVGSPDGSVRGLGQNELNDLQGQRQERQDLGLGQADRTQFNMDQSPMPGWNNPEAQGGVQATGSPDEPLTGLGNDLRGAPDLEGVREPAYHGSPYKFDRFDLSKVNTGERNQAYGWGIYLAEKPGTAKTYQEKLSGGIEGLLVDPKEARTTLLNRVHKAALKNNDTGGLQIAGAHIDRLLQDAQNGVFRPGQSSSWPGVMPSAFKELQKFGVKTDDLFNENKGHFYSTEIPESHTSKMLDWDASLSEQPENVRSAIKLEVVKETEASDSKWLLNLNGKTINGYKTRKAALAEIDGMTGERLYKLTNPSQFIASRTLKELGIPGIKYLDGTSRSWAKPRYFVENVHQDGHVINSFEFDSKEKADKFVENFQKNLSKQLKPERIGTPRLKVTEPRKGTRNFVVFDQAVLDEISGKMSVEEARKTYDSFGNMSIAPPRQMKDGRFFGAPTKSGKATEQETDDLASMLVDKAVERGMPFFEKAAFWYEKAGQMIATYAKGDPKLTEDMTRITAYMSADSSLGTNVAAVVESAYHLAKGEKFSHGFGRYPVSGRTDAKHLNAVMEAKVFDSNIDGVSDKVMSFYRNLRDPAFQKNDFPQESTLDKWMHRIMGYTSKTEVFNPSQYAYGRMVMQRAAEQANKRLNRTDILPRHIQAAAWVNGRKSDVSEFADYMNRRTAFSPFEVRSGMAPDVSSWPQELQDAFYRDALNLIHDGQGNNRVLAEIGQFPLQSEVQGRGVWEGVISPNTMTMVVLPGGAENTIDPGPGRLFALYVGYGYSQDAALSYVPAHNAKTAESYPGIEFVIEQGRISTENVRNALPDTPFSEFVMPDGRQAFHFLNMTKNLSPKARKAWIESVRMQLEPVAKSVNASMMDFKARGSLDFGGQDNADYLQGLREAGRPDLQDGARRLRADFQALIERYREKAQGQGTASESAEQVREPTHAYQQEGFDFETRPDTTEVQVRNGNAFIGELIAFRDRLRGASVLADAMVKDFVDQGFTSLVGKTAKTAGDFATIDQVNRSAKVEGLHFAFTKGNKIIGHMMVATRMPGGVSFGPQLYPQLNQYAQKIGAEGYWIAHNHPSGRATPSNADLSFTINAAEQLKGLKFRGHVVIDHNEYSVIDKMGGHYTTKKDFGGYKPRTNPKMPHPSLGQSILSPSDLAAVASRLPANKDEATLIATGADGMVSAVTSFPLDLLKVSENDGSKQAKRKFWQATARIRRLRAAAGAGGYVFAVTPNPEALQGAWQNGLFADVVDSNRGESMGGQWDLGLSQKQVSDRYEAVEFMRDGVGKAKVTEVRDRTQPYDPKASLGIPPGKTELGGGTYSNNPYRGSEPDIQQVLLDTMDVLEEKTANQRGNSGQPFTWDMEDELTQQFLNSKQGQTLKGLVDRSPRAAANASVIQAYVRKTVEQAQKVRALSIQFDKTNSNEDRVALLEAKDLLGTLQAATYGYFTEAGRSLGIIRRYQQQMAEAKVILEAIAGSEDAAATDFAGKVKNAKSIGDVLDITHAAYQPTVTDQIREYWINMGLLSGPFTQMVNVIGNTVFMGAFSISELATSVISKDVSTRAALKRLSGMYAGMSTGIENAKKALLTEEPQFNSQMQMDSPKYRAIPGKLGKVIRIPGRLLLAGDEFFKSTNYSGALHQAAMAESEKTGVPFDQVLQSYATNKEVQDRAIAHATRMTFQTPLGEMGRDMMRAREKVPILGWLLFPFVRTPTNIVKEWAKFTPIGMVMPSVMKEITASGERGAVARGQMVFGSMVMSVVAYGVLNGLITGSGPEDPRKRALWLRTGRLPYAFKNPFTGEWQRYNRFEPMSMLMGISADATEISMVASSNDKNLYDKLETVGKMAIGSFMTNVGDKTFLRGASDFIQMANDPERFFEQWSSGLVATALPNFGAQVARNKNVDPYAREARGIVDSLKARVPGEKFHGSLPRRLDVAGEPIPGSGFEPSASSAPRNDPLAEMLLSLDSSKGAPGRTITLQGKRYELSGEEYEDYKGFVQQARWRILTPIVSSPQFKQVAKANPNLARDKLESLYDKIGSQARDVWLLRNREVVRKIASQRQTIEGSQYLQ